MSRNNSNGSEILRRFVQQAESYNRCMFTKTKVKDNVTEQILFCQNQIENLNLSTKKKSNEILMIDIVSNDYKYETSIFQLNIIQQCSIVSIISPSAFTIQLTKDLNDYENFLKTMNDYYNSIDDLHISKEYLRKNLLCVTWDENTLVWNRSQIMEYDLIDDTVNVFYVDLNSWEEHVSRSRLRFILTKYSSRTVSLLTCRLASIISIDNDQQWNDVICKTFQNVVYNCQCDVEPLYKGRDNTFYVNLFASHDEAYVCINDFLIHCKMAKPIDDISNEKNLVYMLDDNGQPMYLMIALYWKAGEIMHEKEICDKQKEEIDHRSSVSIESFQTKCSYESSILTKIIMINQYDKIIFARYNSYIMLPWFTISNILNELNENKIKYLTNKFGFKAIIIDPLSHPLLCSQLNKLKSLSTTLSSEISLYSIDCARKIFQFYQYNNSNIYLLLDQARLAETNNDTSFWENTSDTNLLIPYR